MTTKWMAAPPDGPGLWLIIRPDWAPIAVQVTITDGVVRYDTANPLGPHPEWADLPIYAGAMYRKIEEE